MTTQTKAQRLAEFLRGLEVTANGINVCDNAADELLRLEADKDDWKDASFVFKERAVKAETRIKELEAANAELLTALVDVSYTLEKARIWGGMDWHYNPLHPVHYLPARDKARAVIEKHGCAT